MHVPSFDRQKRAQVLLERERIINRLVEIDDLMAGNLPDSARQKLDEEETNLHKARDANLEQYARAIPRMPVSVCPYCDRPAIKAFDPVALDGFWWMDRTIGVYPDESVCPHYRVMRGALNLEGRPARGGRYDCRPGPEVPYVIPRLLGLRGMLLVVSSIPLDCGYTAYPLVYFSDQNYPPGSLTAEWRTQEYYFKDDAGNVKFSIPQDPWDFDLEVWIRKGKLAWIKPGENKLSPPSAAPADCPYVNLPGRRSPLLIRENDCFTEALPDGQEVELFD